MDTINIALKSAFSRSIISGMIARELKRRFHLKDVNVDIRDLGAVTSNSEGSIKIHLDGELTLQETDLLNLVIGGK